MLRTESGLADRVFLVWARSSGALVLIVMLSVGGYLAVRASDALRTAGTTFLTVQDWNPDGGRGQFGIAAVLVGTVLIGGIAVCLAVPLALGRALGETITVYLILSMHFEIQPHILQTGGSAVAPLIALRYGDSSPFSVSALMAAGLTLFLLTLVVNFAAAAVVARSRSGAGS